jgi:hypothetical protein
LKARTGDQAAVVWQLAQVFVVDKCVAVLPVALVPLWQEAQLPLTLAWLNFADAHEVVA